MAESPRNKSLADAMHDALRACGIRLLADPKALYAALTDVAPGRTPEMRVLRSVLADSGDGRVLEPLAGLGSASRASDVEAAARQVFQWLTAERLLAEGVSASIAEGLAEGTARYYGIALPSGGLSVVPRPAPVPAPKPAAATPKPAAATAAPKPAAATAKPTTTSAPKPAAATATAKPATTSTPKASTTPKPAPATKSAPTPASTPKPAAASASTSKPAVASAPKATPAVKSAPASTPKPAAATAKPATASAPKPATTATSTSKPANSASSRPLLGIPPVAWGIILIAVWFYAMLAATENGYIDQITEGLGVPRWIPVLGSLLIPAVIASLVDKSGEALGCFGLIVGYFAIMVLSVFAWFELVGVDTSNVFSMIIVILSSVFVFPYIVFTLLLGDDKKK